MNSVNNIAYAAFIALAAISTSAASAQNASGVRPINKGPFKSFGQWLDSSTIQFKTIYPIIRSIPPGNSFTPDAVAHAYLSIDSLMRYDTAGEAIIRIRDECALNDTLFTILTLLHRVTDYDPPALRQYALESMLQTRYHWPVMALANEAIDCFERHYSGPKLKAYVSLITSDYVLRVRVVQVDSAARRADSTDVVHMVRAQVLDTMKGRVFNNCAPQSGPSVMPAATDTASICFNYVRQNYSPAELHSSGEHFRITSWEPEFTAADSSGVEMTVGQEAIVFLHHRGHVVDSTHDGFELFINPEASLGALPIVGSRVYDVNQIWNASTVGYSSWQAGFQAIERDLSNGVY